MTAPAPVTDDADTGGHFAAAGRGALAVCECARCGRLLHMPRRWCHHCAAADVVWRDVSPTGTVHAFTVVTHQVHPDFPVPYTVLLIDLDDAAGARLVGRVSGRPAVAVGDPVHARFVAADAGAGVPEWQLGRVPAGHGRDDDGAVS